MVVHEQTVMVLVAIAAALLATGYALLPAGLMLRRAVVLWGLAQISLLMACLGSLLIFPSADLPIPMFSVLAVASGLHALGMLCKISPCPPPWIVVAGLGAILAGSTLGFVDGDRMQAGALALLALVPTLFLGRAAWRLLATQPDNGGRARKLAGLSTLPATAVFATICLSAVLAAIRGSLSVDHPAIALGAIGGPSTLLLAGTGGAFLIIEALLEQVRSGERRYRALLDQSLVGIYELTGNRLTYVNAALAAMFDYPRDSLLGREAPDILVAPEDQAKVRDSLDRRFAGLIQEDHYTFTGLRRDGQRIQVEVNSMVRQVGETQVITGVILDVTARRDAEQALRTLNKTLENRIAEQTETLRQEVFERRNAERQMARALTEAQISNRAKNALLSSMSHELRTPLNAIIGFAEIMEAQIFGALGDQRYKDYATDIRRSANRLLGVISDVLDSAAVDSGALALQEEICALDAILESASRLTAPRAVEAGVLFVPPARLDIMIKADPRRLRQVVLNLLSNAVKFTPAGGKVWVDAQCTRDGGLAITIGDTGIGMDEGCQRTALSRFHQTDDTLARRWEGAGLGLSLAADLVKLHNGRLSVDSVVGSGTRITVVLPPDRVLPKTESQPEPELA